MRIKNCYLTGIKKKMEKEGSFLINGQRKAIRWHIGSAMYALMNGMLSLLIE